MEKTEHFDRCCNPFHLENHQVKKGLRLASEDIQIKFGMTRSHYLCTNCRHKASKVIKESNKNSSKNRSSADKTHDSNDDITDNINDDNSNGNDNNHKNSDDSYTTIADNNDGYELEKSLGSLSFQSGPTQSQSNASVSDVSVETQLPHINEALKLLNESPLAPRKLNDERYLCNKVNKICRNLKSTFRLESNAPSNIEDCERDFLSLLEQLKNKFNHDDTTRSEKIQILTLLPMEWSARKVSEFMNASRHMVNVAKKLAETKGLLSKPESKLGHVLSSELKSKIYNFYIDDEVSVTMPGAKDYVSVRNDDGNREHLQKRLILSNLNELYQKFRENYPDDKIGFSKFASLRPKNCVLAGSNGTHTICVCMMHQNMKLLILGANLSSLTSHLTKPLKHYTDCINLIMCDNQASGCYLGKCSVCPEVNTLSNMLSDVFDQNEIDTLTYKYWISKPRTTLETMTSSSEDFIDRLCEDLLTLLPHAFIAKEQASFMKSLKMSLKERELLIVCDFAENYAFVVQNAASGFHWNNNTSTIYPVVIYFKENDELVHRSLVIISDCNNHDSIAVYVFTKIITDFVKSIIDNPYKIYYFSDGAPQQFKNYKNFVNLYHHKDDFGIKAEWHFFATAHGKGPCDGIGGTVKRMAARASLQLPVDQQITTPLELYYWASQPNTLPNITATFSSAKDYNDAAESLNNRFKSTTTIKGTQKIHCVIPNDDGSLILKDYSNSSESKIHKLFKRQRQ